MKRPLAWAALALAAVWGPIGCDDEPRTEIVVVLDSDMRVPGEIDGVEVEITSPNGETSQTSGDLATEPLPRSVGIVLEGGPLSPVVVRARATLDGATVVEREVSTAFVQSETVVLLVSLLRSCAGMSCDADESCGERGCDTTVVDSSRLPRWSGEEPRIDGAVPAPPRDGSTDAMRDAGSLDAATRDAGSTDASRDAGSLDAATRDASSTDAATPDEAGADTGPLMCSVEVGDCNADSSDGCETSLRTDDDCGACGDTCRGGGRHCCPDGTCARPPCP